MINITFERPNDDVYVFDPDSYFECVYEEDWFNDNLVKDIIRDIDNSEYISNGVFIHKDFGAITYRELSSSTKTLILIYKSKNNDSVVYKLSNLGDNCYKYLKYISPVSNATFYANTTIKSEYGEVQYFMKDTNTVIDNFFDFIEEMLNYEINNKYNS